ncbi:MAG: GIY-YIG nuclease family protein [Elusimicrobia bacterium]|nr:GIY-YIG nuclease family protein [Elusimicrobiota bacterium]
MFKVYILRSLKDSKYYTGSTGNLKDRLKRHFDGRSLATKNRRPLILVYNKSFSTKIEALDFELYIKKQKSKFFIERLISSALIAQTG